MLAIMSLNQTYTFQFVCLFYFLSQDLGDWTLRKSLDKWNTNAKVIDKSAEGFLPVSSTF